MIEVALEAVGKAVPVERRDEDEVGGVRHPVEVLVVPLLFFLGVAKVLGGGHPGREELFQAGVIGGGLGKYGEAGWVEDVDADGIVVSKGLEEAKGLGAGVGEIGPGEVAGVDHEDGGAGEVLRGCCAWRKTGRR